MAIPTGPIPSSHPLAAYVISEPDRLNGTPCFRGTRVPVDSLFEHLRENDPIEVFLADFPGVTREQVDAVLRFAQGSVLHHLNAA